MRPIGRRSAGKDSVKVFRIPLRFHQSLATAVGTSGEIVQRRIASIECADDSLGLNAGFMYGTIAEVDELFGMTYGPGCASAAFVAVIGRSRRITTSQRIDHSAISNVPGPAAISQLLIFAIPAINGKPYRGLDLGI